MAIVSVIIPTYGTPDKLEDAIRSVLDQTFSDLELIVVDDNNPDTEPRKRTAEILARFIEADKRVRYICHEHNKNGAAARNTGIRASSGEYVSFLDSDDYYDKTRIEKCIAALKNDKTGRAEGVYTGCELRKNDKTYRRMTNVHSGNFLYEYLKMEFNLFTGSNIFITRKAMDALKGFDESFIRHQDVEFLVRFFYDFDIIGLPEVLVYKNCVGNNNPSAEKTIEIKQHFLDTFEETIRKFPKRKQKKIYGANYRKPAELFLLEKKYKKAFACYRKVIANNSLTPKAAARAVAYFIRSL